jgi:hypothetical protein
MRVIYSRQLLDLVGSRSDIWRSPGLTPHVWGYVPVGSGVSARLAIARSIATP